MNENTLLLSAIAVVVLAFPLGKYLSGFVKEELSKNKKLFSFIIIIFALISVVSLILRNDFFLFSSLFVIFFFSGFLKIKKPISLTTN